MDEPMISPRGTADAEALGVIPLRMGGARGALRALAPRGRGPLRGRAEGA